MTTRLARVLANWTGGRKRSFQYAFQGLRRLYRETNARLHAVATLLAIALGAALGLTLRAARQMMA